MKPPAFQFYPDDFIGGTVDLSAEDVGAYIRLLCYQWGVGSIPSDAIVLDRIAGCKVSSRVVEKFPNGMNHRLEAERQKQASWRAKCSAGGAKSSEIRKLRSRVVATPLQVNGQVNVNTPSPSPPSMIHHKQNRRFDPPSKQEVELQAAKIGLPAVEADKFIAFYESKGWKVGKEKMASWKGALSGWRLRWQQSSQTELRSETHTPATKLNWKDSL